MASSTDLPCRNRDAVVAIPLPPSLFVRMIDLPGLRHVDREAHALADIKVEAWHDGNAVIGRAKS